MAYIKNFTIEGLAGREGAYSANLNPKINIFFGLNGSGKTSLLRILHSAMEGDAKILETVPFQRAEITIHSNEVGMTFTKLIHKEKSKIIHRLDNSKIKTDIGEEKEKLEWKSKLPLPKKFLSIKWPHVYLPTWRIIFRDEPWRVGLYAERLAERREDYWDKAFAKEIENLWSTYTKNLLFDVRKIQADGLANIMRGVLSTKKKSGKKKDLDIKLVYQRAAAFLKRQDSPAILGSLNEFKKRILENPDIQGIANDINLIEQNIENAMSSRYKIENLIHEMFTGNKSINFGDKGIEAETLIGQNIGVSSLSSGEKHVLWIFIDALIAEASSLLIDEPEISLHVDWQNRLISDITQLNPEAQLIMATHSPEIMANISDNYIFRL